MYILFISAAIFLIYALCSVLLSLKLSLFARLGVTFFLVFCSAKYYIYAVSGSILEPKLSVSSIVILESLYSFLMILVLFLIIKDLYLLIVLISRKFLHCKFRLPNLNLTILFMGGIALVVGFAGTLYQFKTPNVVSHVIYVKNLNPALEGLKVVQLSDLHIGPLLKDKWLARVVERVNSINPDVVLITGDFVDGSADTLSPLFLPLKDLNSTYGTYGVSGNHEFYSGYKSWLTALEHVGVHFLENQSIEIKHHGSTFTLAGVSDLRGDNFGIKSQSAAQVLKNNTELTILMAHEPSVVAEQPSADLLVTGHTHGGVMFFLKPLIAKFNAGFVSGLYKINDRLNLYVSNGTGIWSGFSCRILVSSEITLFTFKKAN